MWRWASRARTLPLLVVLLGLATACAPGASRASVTPTATPSVPVSTPTLRPSPTACNYATQWKPPKGNIGLNSLSMASATEGWASGELNPYEAPNGTPQYAVLFHLLNGQWSRLPQTYLDARLTSLSMDSPTDGWAVSPYPIRGSSHPLVLHYTGSAWQPVDVPALDAVLQPTAMYPEGHSIDDLSVKMFGAQAGWMFAPTYRDPDDPEGPRTLVLRFESGRWTQIPGPAITNAIDLFGFSAVSANEAWIVGTEYTSTDETTLFYHYTNGGWTQDPQTFSGLITQSLIMLAPNEGWAGASDEATGQPLLHYDGKSWSAFTAPAILKNQGVTVIGGNLIYPVAPGVTWFTTDTNNTVGMWQDANGQWSQVSWPYSDIVPDTLFPGGGSEVWGMANIIHTLGCAPAQVAFIPQGVFLHKIDGLWIRQDLP